jgi:hypothetical protein
LKLIGNLGQRALGDPLALPVSVEKAQYALGLLKGLN